MSFNEESNILGRKEDKLDSISNNFRYHRPGESTESKHESVRNFLGAVAQEINRVIPHGRESALVQTKLEEAMFWANAAIARNQS